MRIALSLAVLLGLVATAGAGWPEDLDALIRAEPGPDRDTLLARVADAAPGWKEVAAAIEARAFPLLRTGETTRRTVHGLDGVDRPYALHVPASYDPERPTPLLVVLHGGVSRPELIEDPVAYATRNPWRAVAERRGWLAVYPMGQMGATWWDRVGLTNVTRIVRAVKRDLNVDDDRVWMEGFSDGASAGLLRAMILPSDFAAIVSLNGHMGTGSLIGELPIYATNFVNTPLYVVTTDADQLFPTARMAPHLEMARRAGGDILYRQHEGPHDFVYAKVETPLVERFLLRHPRDPFPTRIDWECGDRRFGLCRWFAIDRVGMGEPAPWHRDHNAILVDDRVSIGFYHDDKYEGEGIRIARVVEKSFAASVDLRPGDVLLAANDTPTPTLDALNAFKATVNRGDPVTLTVRRGEETVTLPGRLPDVGRSFLFQRDVPSARARVSFVANRVDVEASRLGAFRILVHPDLFRLEHPIVVRVNGKTVHDAKVEPDLRVLLESYLENRDRRLLYVAEVRVELDGD